MVTGEVFAAVLAGVAVGAAMGLGTTRYIEALFYHVKSSDAVMFVIPSGTPSCQQGGALRIPRIRPIRVESELRLTARELRSRGSGASLDVREDSMPVMTLLPGA